jgi:hypothetical protein
VSINLPIVSKFDPKGLQQAQDGLKAFGESSKTTASNVGKAFGAIGLAVGAAATGLIVASVKAFGELEQNLGGSEAVFGKYALDLQDTAAAAFKNMGISQSEFLATANKMGALFQGSGITQVDALQMTEDAMQRAADMASVMGIDMSVAMDAVTGAAKGNFTMMDNLGVAMNATSIQAYAVGKGMTDFSYSTATSAEKVGHGNADVHGEHLAVCGELCQRSHGNNQRFFRDVARPPQAVCLRAWVTQTRMLGCWVRMLLRLLRLLSKMWCLLWKTLLRLCRRPWEAWWMLLAR